MPLYELFCIAAVRGEAETHALIRAAASHVMAAGGSVCAIDHLGVARLPYRMRSHGVTHSAGRYFALRFHAAPRLPESLWQDLLKPDERVIRAQTVKLATTIPETVRYLQYERRQANLGVS